MNKMMKDILWQLLGKGELTRDELVIHLQKPRTTVYDNLYRLKLVDLVEKNTERQTYKIGRPIVRWKITRRGIDVLNGVPGRI